MRPIVALTCLAGALAASVAPDGAKEHIISRSPTSELEPSWR